MKQEEKILNDPAVMYMLNDVVVLILSALIGGLLMTSEVNWSSQLPQ